MDQVWGWDSEAEVNVVWVNISSLRRKIEELGAHVEIRVSRGIGSAGFIGSTGGSAGFAGATTGSAGGAAAITIRGSAAGFSSVEIVPYWFDSPRFVSFRKPE